ncbi:MAG: hypothetical protein Q8O76_10230 [Chloroflexota bacterium]|nr:hypothetical protein [Chloroflexota bacterium]
MSGTRHDDDRVLAVLFASLAGTAISGIICGVIVGITILSISLTSTSGARTLEANSQTVQVYRESITAIETGMASRGNTALFDAANLQQVQAYSETLSDLRKLAYSYNSRLRIHRYWQDSFWFGWYWANVSNDLQPITDIK